MINGKFVVPPTLADVFDMHEDDIGSKLRVCMVGYIKTYDPVKRTASVILAENLVLNDGTVVEIKKPLLDVPVFTLQGGGVHVGFPIKASDTSADGKGDECLLVFADFNIDNWHLAGGQQTPTDARQHDISDGFALVGPNSLANPVATSLLAGEGGLASSAAKVAVAPQTQLITIANGPLPANNLNGILQTLLTALATATTFGQINAAAATAATQLATLLY